VRKKRLSSTDHLCLVLIVGYISTLGVIGVIASIAIILGWATTTT
jgi:hypothetical protein